MITQNIDNYHSQLLRKSKVIKTEETKDGDKNHGFTNGVLEIHGNVFYMRWLKEWTKDILTMPQRNQELEIEEQIPKWENCGSIMRPHTLWFDETYWDEYYKLNSVRKVIESNVDALIVVGTTLSTALAFRIVKECLKRDILTIEVNLEPKINSGHWVQTIEWAESALPLLFKPFIS